ncbi:MAG TPA: outer membrane protein [Burkholderiales bacterium]|nr:outer membrane protein [Burkholderiales bacterium]
MKKFLLAATCFSMLQTAALSADPVVTTTSVITAVPSRWSGSYIGLHTGYSRGRDSTSTVTGFPDGGFVGLAPAVPASYSLKANGFIGGLQIGHNSRINNVVLGIEADISYSKISGTAATSGVVAGPVPFTFNERQMLDWFGTLRGRLGFTPLDRLMIYGTGGVAYGQVRASTNLTFPGLSFIGSDTSTRVGWTAGAGAEYAVTNSLTAKLEYLYYDLGGATVVGYPTPPIPPFNTHTDFRLAGHVVRAGMNYQFNESPAQKTANAAGTTNDAQPSLTVPETEFGIRYWYSSGKTAQDLYDTTGSAIVSRPTYSDLTAHSGEFFFRANDHSSGAFFKGYVGLGKVTNGNLKDEDFPPGVVPYSATSSDLKDGNITYASADVGFNFLKRPSYRLGAFVGYHYYHEKLNAHGCTQTASNPVICVSAIPDSTLVITNDGIWHSVRLGLVGDIMLAGGLKLTADAAWLPYTRLDSHDTHWLRIGTPGGFTGPIPDDGTGHSGVQLEAILSYQVTQMFSLGVGGRYWHVETKGNAHFEDVAFGGGGLPQPVNFKTERYGGLLQGTFKF